MSKYDFPSIWTVWVLREKPCFIGARDSEEAAIDFGNRTVSTKDFVVKQYSVVDLDAKPKLKPLPKAEESQIEFENLPAPDLSY